MAFFYIFVIVAILGAAVFFICKEYMHTSADKENVGSHGVLKNKKQIENMVANVESVLVYANGNDLLCNRLVEVKDNIRFFNPTTNQKALLVDAKIANRLDDLKSAVAKDNTQETCFRILEEVEAFIVQRKKEEQA
ncbi:MAG: hypothetical protein MJ152_04590 [Clostridia bacterium]|nr:hypothetical protein [Clostridia bacterium]